MSQTCEDLSISVEYTSQRTRSTSFREDMDYLRKRIMTHRSVHSREIGEIHGRYYEGAKTLVDLLELILPAINGSVDSCTVSIDPTKASAIYASGSVSIPGRDPTTHIITCQMTVHYGITLAYTMADTYTDDHPGYFTINIRVSDWDHPDNDQSVSIGNIGLSSCSTRTKRGDLYCIPANPNRVLGYCENFPTPSNFTHTIIEAWLGLIEKLKGENTDGSTESHEECGGSPVSAVPQEG